MKEQENCSKENKPKSWVNIFLIILTLAVLVLLFVFKNSFYGYLTNNQIQQKPIQTQDTTTLYNDIDLFRNNIPDSTFLYIDSLFNSTNNKKPYSLTFLEFGSTGCIECKKMEKVLEEVKLKYKNKVNVLFYNVTKKENKKISAYYKIQMIPVQVLLDKNGKEFFRHLGFYSFEDLIKQFKNFGVQ